MFHKVKIFRQVSDKLPQMLDLTLLKAAFRLEFFVFHLKVSQLLFLNQIILDKLLEVSRSSLQTFAEKTILTLEVLPDLDRFSSEIF